MDRPEALEFSETGRRLGHDLFRYGRLAHERALPRPVMEGIADARGRGVVRETADRFVGKWVQIRLNAFRRERVVDHAVTPALIAQIDVPVCPVTREHLTHGAMLSTDWSVDRLNNDGAYAPNNLAVMSSRANRAKGSRSFEDVIVLSRAAEEVGGLTPLEWLRMASLMLGPCFAEQASRAPVIPLAAPIPGRTARQAVQLIQYAFTQGAAAQSGKNLLIRRFRPVCRTEAAHARLDRFADAMHVALKHSTPCWDAWLRPEVFAAFVSWRNTLDLRSWMLAGEVAREFVGGRRIAADHIRDWRLDQRGYVQ